MTINSPVNIHKGDNITVVHKRFPLALNNSKFSSFAPRHRLSKLISALGLASVVILTKRSVGRIPRRDLERDICEMFHFVQHDKLCFGQHLYYYLHKYWRQYH